MTEKKTSLPYKLIKALVRLFYPRTEIKGAENLPAEPCIVVGNHTQMNGPIVSELYLPGRHDTWCAGEMMKWREVPGYAYRDFWSEKPRAVRWFYKLLSYVITPLAVCVFNNANTLAVYHDTRIITTFRESMRRLQEGTSMVIFPEYGRKYNNIIYDFQDKFIDLARMYYKKTGQALAFVPVYIAPSLKKAVYGAPVRFDPAAPKDAERARIRDYLMDAITRLACGLPEHTVVPYRNVPKRDYPKNLPLEVYAREENPV